ncbi:MAG TPA: PAS domain S-box protein [Bacteroidales bacterium]|nr:PAS domain S-box protein [Bacteroidales bacterium]
MTLIFSVFSFLFGLIIGFSFLYLYKKKRYIQEQAQNWLETFNAISDPIAILSTEGKVLQSNKAMDFFNLNNSKKITDHYCYELIHKTKEHIEGCPLVRAKKSFHREEMELTINNNIFLVSVDPIIKNNKISSFVHIIKDITHLKKLQNEMEEEKRKFETLVNNLPGFVYRCANDKDWTMEYISEGVFAITGYSPDEIINNKVLSFNDIIAEEYREILREKWQKVLKKKETFEHEYQIITKSGERRDVWERGQGIFDAHGHLLFLEGFITDITEKNKIFSALLESEEKFKALSDSTTASIFIYQEDNFVYVNPATEQLTGYDYEELLHTKFWDIVHPDYKELVKERGKMRLMGIPQPPNYDFKIIRKDGCERWIKFSAGYLQNYKGKTAAIGTAIDITDLIDIQSKLQESIAQLEEGERLLKQQNEEYLSLNEELTQNNQRIHKLNEELIKAKEKAEASDRLKTSFLNNISHEIRTPLNAIMGFSDLLSKRKVSEEKAEQYLHIIKASGNHLLGVITNIINVATIEAGEEKIFYNKTNINQLIENSINSLAPLIAKKDVEFQFTEKLPHNKMWILADETKLQQIILNLITNAIKFTEEGFIRISINENNQQLILKIKDTGIGIEEQLQPYVFERFVQVSDIIKKHPSSGMGLGLSLVKSYVNLMGGSISLQSKVGQGTEFTITLPYLPIEEKEETKDLSRHFIIPENKKILLAEDTQNNIDLIVELLLPYKIEIIIAKTGLEALEQLNHHPDISLILMDIKMPEMDGYTACEEIKKINPSIPIIALTAYNNEDEFEKMKTCGMKGYLTKPINEINLLSTLEDFLTPNKN